MMFSKGGGLVGGTYLLEMDGSTRHWKSLVRYYMGEAQAVGHELLVIGAQDFPPDEFVRAGLFRPFFVFCCIVNFPQRDARTSGYRSS